MRETDVLSFSGQYIYIVCYLVLLIGLGIGWVQEFPRWSYPYLSLVLVFTWWWMDMPAGILNRYHKLFGWQAWIPFFVMVVIVLLLTRSLRPLPRLVTGVWHDWTRLSFGLYGVMPWLVWATFDENHSPYMMAYLGASTFFLTGGALAYMRGTRAWQRALALLVGMTLSWTVQTAGNALYWGGRWEPWMKSEPDRWYEIVGKNAIASVILAALMFAPALLNLLHRSAKSMRAV